MQQAKSLLISWLLLLGFSQALISQSTFISARLTPESGDTLYFQTDELPRRISISPPGENQLWNFTSLLAPYLENQFINNPGEQLEVSRNNVRNLYEVQKKGLIWKGGTSFVVGKTQINHKWSSDAGVPLPSWQMKYQDDLDFESTYSCVFSAVDIPQNWRSAIPRGVDSVRVTIMVTRSMTADATGTIMLTGGSRYNVHRIRVEDVLIKKLWIKKSDTWTDLTNTTGLDDLLPEKTRSYHFISDEQGGIVCSVDLASDGDVTQVQFITPTEQANSMRKVVPSQWLFAYPNPALSVVRFKFLDIPSGKYTIRFYDILLRNLMEREYNLAGSETVEININQLEKGTYLFSLVDENGKKIVTKRLIVIKP
ncbi:MAG: T9SS type A sorting domain-containing protein [Saprospiraceae bacterium]|nr:T9SS type A sorting domain-containing protein [Saprospiraceae bacterium]